MEAKRRALDEIAARQRAADEKKIGVASVARRRTDFLAVAILLMVISDMAQVYDGNGLG